MRPEYLIFALLGAVLAGLAAPPALLQRSWLRFFIGLGLGLVGVVLPLFFFFFSAGLVPEWKGGCELGWINCIHLGKLALAPLVLWATAALYVVDICQASAETRKSGWIVLGYFVGAVVASVCFLYGIMVTVPEWQQAGVQFWFMLLAVPAYTAVWYCVRFAQLYKVAELSGGAYVKTLAATLPFWVGGVIWSRWIYASLPDKPPECFVVTAAGRGHEAMVGPFVSIERNGRVLRANRQLLTLWQFEADWRRGAPRSHRAFRRVYNRVGPVVARQVRSPWLADAAYCVIKPVEILARVLAGVRRPGHQVAARTINH